MSRKRPAADLLKAGNGSWQVQTSDPPVTKGMGYLAAEQGNRLEMMTRTNRAIISGISAGSAYVYRYESPYIQGKVDRLMRLAVSSGGEGRKEMIAMVQAGGQMSDAYYDSGNAVQQDYAVGDDE